MEQLLTGNKPYLLTLSLVKIATYGISWQLLRMLTFYTLKIVRSLTVGVAELGWLVAIAFRIGANLKSQNQKLGYLCTSR